VDLLLDGVATRFAEGFEAAAPLLKRALREAQHAAARDDAAGLWPWLAARVASDLWDDDALHALASRQTELAREAGALTVLPIVLYFHAALHVIAGEPRAAAALVQEGHAITDATGNAPMSYTEMLLEAWHGDEERTTTLIARTVEDATARGDGMAITIAECATAVLRNGLGHYGAALSAAEEASAYEELGIAFWSVPELVEAAVRSGRREVAVAAFERLRARTQASGTDWALGLEASCRALLSSGPTADALYREAIDRLGRTRAVAHVARTRLLYGEWLRRERRRLEAREQLRRAHAEFVSMGAEAFAARAARELAATGERARRRTADTLDRLTPQEARIARLAGGGESNAEIGVELFISPRTVEYHLSRVFRKLGLDSRAQLADALDAGGDGDPS
jgi:DNA-binding CsgD family transcriptional regulator